MHGPEEFVRRRDRTGRAVRAELLRDIGQGQLRGVLAGQRAVDGGEVLQGGLQQLAPVVQHLRAAQRDQSPVPAEPPLPHRAGAGNGVRGLHLFARPGQRLAAFPAEQQPGVVQADLHRAFALGGLGQQPAGVVAADQEAGGLRVSRVGPGHRQPPGDLGGGGEPGVQGGCFGCPVAAVRGAVQPVRVVGYGAQPCAEQFGGRGEVGGGFGAVPFAAQRRISRSTPRSWPAISSASANRRSGSWSVARSTTSRKELVPRPGTSSPTAQPASSARVAPTVWMS